MRETFVDIPAELRDLSLEDKISLLSGSGFWETVAMPGRGVRSLLLSDGPHGIRRPSGDSTLGLGESVPATCFPAECATASSWDRSLLAELGTAVAREARLQGVDVLLGPGLNIKRTPLCGRNFEYFSEDPLLAGELGAAWVEAVQGAGIGTSPKHFAANNQEADRMRVDAVVDPRTLHEIYLRAFEIVVRTAAPWTIMAAYNKINGLHAAENPWLLGIVLRGTWGYEGAVMSDWGAVTNRATALAAGLDLEMPSSGGLGAREITAGLDAGLVTEEQINAAAARILALVKRAPVQDASQPDGAGEADAAVYAASHDLARRAAAASMVLLKNDGALLPLEAGGTVAVIGELARTPRYQGSGSSRVNPVHLVSPLEALQEELPNLLFEPGYSLPGSPAPESTGAPLSQPDAGPVDLIETAAAAAAAAGTAVVFLGLPDEAESEGYDRTTLDLPDTQLELLTAVVEANPRTVVVLFNGGVVTTAWAAEVPALLEAWLPGEAVGSAVADVLLGRTDPGGRLAETIPLRLEDTAAYGNYPGDNGSVRYGEGVLVGYRWYDTRRMQVAFPFGHGLSYTSFGYTDLEIRRTGLGADQVVELEVTVTNTGSRSGSDVVQLYVGAPENDGAQQRPVRALRELRGFEKVQLDPGESRRLRFSLDTRALSRFDPLSMSWVADAGEYRIEAGASSRDIRLAGVAALDGTVPAPGLSTASSIQEWLADPAAAAELVSALAASALGGGEAAGQDGEAAQDRVPASDGAGGLATSLALVGNMPLNRMARFPGSPVTSSLLKQLEGWLQGTRVAQ